MLYKKVNERIRILSYKKIPISMKNQMKHWAFSILFIGGLAFPSCQNSKEVIICSDSVPQARIVVSAHPTEIERHSSVVLQDYLHRVTGATYQIVTDESAPQANDINIGKVNRPEIANINFEELAQDGYIIRTENNRLTIAGGSQKGTLYGVYGFLEKYLGCRKFTSTCSVVPSQLSVEVSNVDVKEIPVFNYREILYKDAYQPEFADWHGLGKHQKDAYGDGEWGSWCHTTFSLVPPSEYGTKHPEYYSLINGKRVFTKNGKVQGDICWSHPEVFKIAAKNLEGWIKKNPDALYWSVSQQDNEQYCRCPLCQKAYDETGSTQGTILPFINKMAKRFPDKTVSTLAYWYSTRPPKGINVEKNVNVMLCNIQTPRHKPIPECDSTFTADIKAWHQIHDNFIIWDYVIQFSNLIAPFPNLRTLQPNLQFLHKNGVKAMFEQGNRETGGEFCELKTYVLAKLLWNPYQDVNALIDDFLHGFYGPACNYVREYIDTMHDSMEESGAKLSIFGRPWDHKDTFLSEAMIEKYYAILYKAEEAVKDYPEFLSRVHAVKLQVDYAVLDIAKGELTGKRGAMEMKDGKQVVKDTIRNLLETTMRTSNMNGVTRIHEWTTTPIEYINEYLTYLKGQCNN